MLLTDVQSYDSYIFHLSISTKFTGDANFSQTAETYLYIWYLSFSEMIDFCRDIGLLSSPISASANLEASSDSGVNPTARRRTQTQSGCARYPSRVR